MQQCKVYWPFGVPLGSCSQKTYNKAEERRSPLLLRLDQRWGRESDNCRHGEGGCALLPSGVAEPGGDKDLRYFSIASFVSGITAMPGAAGGTASSSSLSTSAGSVGLCGGVSSSGMSPIVCGTHSINEHCSGHCHIQWSQDDILEIPLRSCPRFLGSHLSHLCSCTHTVCPGWVPVQLSTCFSSKDAAAGSKNNLYCTRKCKGGCMSAS